MGDVRYIVVKDGSSHWAKTIKWTVKSRPIKRLEDAQAWLGFCQEEDPKNAEKYFIVTKVMAPKQEKQQELDKADIEVEIFGGVVLFQNKCQSSALYLKNAVVKAGRVIKGRVINGAWTFKDCPDKEQTIVNLKPSECIDDYNLVIDNAIKSLGKDFKWNT